MPDESSIPCDFCQHPVKEHIIGKGYTKHGPWCEVCVNYCRLEVVVENPGTGPRINKQEIRTTSSTGGQKGVKPERMSLIPVEALEIMGRLYGFGAEKYAAHNWRKGYEWSKSYDSLQRHANAFWRGEDIDEETGLPHLAGVAFHAFTLMIFMQEQPGFDDRFKPFPSKIFQENLDEINRAMNDYKSNSFSFKREVTPMDELETGEG